jgi:integrase/recombinase XerD
MKDYLTLALLKFVKHMKMERLSERTILAYTDIVKKLAKIDSRLYRLSNEQIQDFILEAASGSAQNLRINALKKFFLVNHPEKKIKVFIRPRKERKLIEVLSQFEVMSIINSINHPKQKAIISGLYFHGLRLNELLNLKYNHIDRSRNLIIIREGKGKKDRLVPLHVDWVEYLKVFASFAGHRKGYDNYIFRPYSESSVRSILKRKSKQLGIKKNIYPHLLRDSFATHLLEQGIDSRFIQEILGHEKIQTTQKYLHVSAVNISKISLKIA